MSNLITLIEVNRKKMIELSEMYGRCSIEVVKCSQELDVLLNLLMIEEACSTNHTISTALKSH
jgi:hypothetical protein